MHHCEGHHFASLFAPHSWKATRTGKLNFGRLWEIDFYPVRVLGGDCARPMRLPDLSSALDKNRAAMGPESCLGLGLGSGERLLWHFQTPVLYWINSSLRNLVRV